MNVVQTQIIAFVQNHPSLTFFNQGSIKPKLPNLSYADSLETFNRYPGIRNEQKTIPWKISDNREIPVDFWKKLKAGFIFSNTVGIWIANIWITETFDYQNQMVGPN